MPVMADDRPVIVLDRERPRRLDHRGAAACAGHARRLRRYRHRADPCQGQECCREILCCHIRLQVLQVGELCSLSR